MIRERFRAVTPLLLSCSQKLLSRSFLKEELIIAATMASLKPDLSLLRSVEAPPLAGMAKEYLASCRSRGLSLRTIDNYQQCLFRLFLPWCELEGIREPGHLNRRALERYAGKQCGGLSHCNSRGWAAGALDTKELLVDSKPPLGRGLSSRSALHAESPGFESHRAHCSETKHHGAHQSLR